MQLAHQQLVVDRLDHDLLRRVLADVEPELELLLALLDLGVPDERRVEALEPVAVVAEAGQEAAGLLGRTENGNELKPPSYCSFFFVELQ